ncbi:class F sortase [Christensenellaceae bacterium OttesenSCG-928-L17]|nr:class F sortase [Christensenellaceae bacterium OttesenSCG-928-L17]
MSLKISNTIRKTLQIIGVAILIILALCLVRVAIWEYNYYKEKEGSPRATISTPFIDGTVEVDETEVTETVIKQHVVSPDKPRYLTISKLGVNNARIIEVSANSGEPMGTPVGIFDVGWARTSGKPGQGGVLLMDGHNGGPTKDGVFKRLDQLRPDDVIIIERGDGRTFTYQVYDTKILNLTEASAYMLTLMESPISGRESLSIITCTGTWINSTRTYDSRVMLRAVLVE